MVVYGLWHVSMEGCQCRRSLIRFRSASASASFIPSHVPASEYLIWRQRHYCHTEAESPRAPHPYSARQSLSLWSISSS